MLAKITQVKTLIFIVVLQIILQIILALPFVFLYGSHTKIGSLLEAGGMILLFTVSLFASLSILKVKNKPLNFKLLNFRLVAFYFAGGVVSIFYGVSYVQLISYPVLAFLVTKVYLRNQKVSIDNKSEIKAD